jgi:hypothetical protein
MELADSPGTPNRSLREMPVDELGKRIVDHSGRLAASMSRWLVMVGHFDALQGHLVFGLASTAQWLSHTCGIAHRTAVEHVRVARALLLHPRLAEEMGAGRLSFSQVRTISRVAGPGEDRLVEDLIGVARRGTVAQLEVVVRGLRTVDHNDKDTDPGEYVKYSWTDDSRWQLTARLDPERGSPVGAAIEAIMTRDGCSPTDALTRLAEIGLAALADATNPNRELRGDERAAVVIHLDAARVPPHAAQRDQAPAPRSAERDPDSPQRDPGEVPVVGRPYARIAGGPGLPDRVVLRLLCEGRIRTVLHDKTSNVLDVGRSHRLVTDRQYRALLARQHGHCAHPGCPNIKNLHAHHRIHWIQGGRTDLANLLLLCERHHVAHHAGEFEIFPDGPGRFRFVSSKGHNLSAPHRAPANADTRLLEDEYARLAADAATTKWDGERLDRRYAVSVLAQRRQSVS